MGAARDAETASSPGGSPPQASEETRHDESARRAADEPMTKILPEWAGHPARRGPRSKSDAGGRRRHRADLRRNGPAASHLATRARDESRSNGAYARRSPQMRVLATGAYLLGSLRIPVLRTE